MFTANEMIKTFKDNTLKLTPQRVAIFRVLEKKAGHITAEKIYGNLTKDYPNISLNTVYTTLKMLVELNKIKELYLNKHRVYYDINVNLHHHIICKVCNKIEDIYINERDININPSFFDSYKDLSYQINFYAICKNCSK